MSSHTTPPLGRIEASIFGESALLDRETGRVFWESGTSSTLYESLTPRLDQFGVEHFQASVLSGILTLAVLGIISGWIQRAILQLRESSLIPSLMLSSPTTSQVVSVLIALTELALLKLPMIENRWLVVLCILLYLLESYNCSTRRFLAHAISTSKELDDYLESLRQEPPIVTWKVKAFHYEYRRPFLLPRFIQSLMRSLLSIASSSRIQKSKEPSAISPTMDYEYTLKHRHTSPKPILTHKIITNEASATYQFGTCRDDTMVGVWTRAMAFRDKDDVAPFTKIALTKLLILADGRTREDYFQQQSNFFTKHGQGDEFAEFSTDIQVAGYRPRMLAVRPRKNRAARLFRLHFFWVFTLLGLTVPYRIWFKQHCDFVRVAVVKEISSASNVQRSWSSTSSNRRDVAKTIFGSTTTVC
ncbi:Tmem151 family protein [Nitzschia inconspicua]|uniref:Tmem151 family protein n=1 Tax=Nitzschia inconspicua TaxID=303405 RepID=A0A9K3KXR3_9STRA|nr:Tmem151 family protein [Nitzschia inconspicua]